MGFSNRKPTQTKSICGFAMPFLLELKGARNANIFKDLGEARCLNEPGAGIQITDTMNLVFLCIPAT